MIEKLNERITIEKSTVVTDKVGNHRNTWEEYFTCFAYASTYNQISELFAPIFRSSIFELMAYFLRLKT